MPGDLERLIERFDEHCEADREHHKALSRQLGAMEERLATLHAGVKELVVLLIKGNGTPPLTVRVDRLEQRDIREEKSRARAMSIAALSLSILSVGFGIWKGIWG